MDAWFALELDHCVFTSLYVSKWDAVKLTEFRTNHSLLKGYIFLLVQFIYSPDRTGVTNCVTTLLFWLFRWHSLISLPTRRGRCPLKVNVKFCESYPKLSNLHEITQFSLDIMLTCLHFWSVSLQEKWCCVWPKIATWKCSLYKWEFMSTVPFPMSPVGKRQRSDGIARPQEYMYLKNSLWIYLFFLHPVYTMYRYSANAINT